MAIGIVIVEDHEIYRDGLKTFFATVPEIEVLGEATTAEEALKLVQDRHPNLVIMDLKLPGMSGIEAIRCLSNTDPEVHVMVLTMFDDDPTVFAAMQAGARGYVLKGARHDELLRAVYAVAEGEAIFSASIATRMMTYFSSPLPQQKRIFRELTEREHEILELIAHRLTTAEIAKRLGLRTKTVRNHTSNIVSKLQVSSRTEAAEQARDRGL